MDNIGGKLLGSSCYGDAIGSRSSSDRDTALAEVRADGVVVTTVEAVLFEMLESSDHPKFREIQALVK